MSENLKTLLQQALDMLEEQALHIEAPMLPAGEELLKRIRAAISQQVETAPAQDEMEPVYQFQWREIGEGDWMACSHSWFRFCEASPEHDTRVVEVARPAQTEQQPVAAPEGWKLVPVQPTAEMLAAVTTSTFEPLRQEAMKMAREDYQAMLYAAPIAQTEQQPLFFINPLVIDELKGKRKPSPGGLTWSRTACGHWTFAVYAAPIAQTAPQGLRIVFDGPPGPEAGRFVEVENASGCSVNAGEWRARADGLWELVLHAAQGGE